MSQSVPADHLLSFDSNLLLEEDKASCSRFCALRGPESGLIHKFYAVPCCRYRSFRHYFTRVGVRFEVPCLQRHVQGLAYAYSVALCRRNCRGFGASRASCLLDLICTNICVDCVSYLTDCLTDVLVRGLGFFQRPSLGSFTSCFPSISQDSQALSTAGAYQRNSLKHGGLVCRAVASKVSRII